MTREQLTFRVETDVFDFIGRHKEANLNTKADLALTPRGWSMLYRALKITSEPHASVEISPGGSVPLRFTIGTADGGDADSHEYMEKLSDLVAQTMDLCGAPDERFDGEAIYKSRHNVPSLIGLFDQAGNPQVTFESSFIPECETLPRRANCYKAFSLGHLVIAYYFTADLVVEKEADALHWRSTSIQPGDIALVSGDEGYRDFIKRANATTGVQLIMVGERDYQQLTIKTTNQLPV